MKSKGFNKKHIYPYLLVAPALITVCCIVFVPAVKAIIMSLQNYDLRYSMDDIKFIGLANYKDVLSDKVFWNALLRTIAMVVICVSMQFLLGFALALLLNRSFRGRGLFRAVSMIPWVVPGVLVGLIWRWMYDGNYGVLNDLLVKVGILDSYYGFLSHPETALGSVFITYIWQGIPFFTLMILAGLQGISADIYEAAEIDGASGWKRLIHVTVPSIKNAISVSLMLRIIWVANSVDVIFNMTEGGPANATQTLAVYIYQNAKSMNLGYSSTVSILLMILLMAVAIPYMIYSFRTEEDS